MGKITIKKKIGNSELGYIGDSKNFKESLAEAAFYATTPDKCTLCDGSDVTLDSNRTQEGYLYVKVRCLNEKCKAQSTLGIYKDETGGFWKAFEKYEPREGSSSSSSEEKPKGKVTKKADDDDDDDEDLF